MAACQFVPDQAMAAHPGFTSALFEEVFIDAFDYIGVLDLHADVVVDHQVTQGLPVDQDHPGGYPVGVRDGVRGEPGWW